MIFAEGIFKGESEVVHPYENEIFSEINIPLRPPKDIPIDLHVKAIVGYKSSFHYHVFELTRHLPRFAMYALTKGCEKPRSRVTFTLNERVPRVIMWLNNNFLLVEEFEYSESFSVAFVSLRDGKPLVLEMEGKTGDLSVSTDNMELAGDIIQSLVSDYLGVQDLSSSADFPHEVESLKRMIRRVEELQSVRQHLAAEIADNSAAIRALVVRAEDARLLGEM